MTNTAVFGVIRAKVINGIGHRRKRKGKKSAQLFCYVFSINGTRQMVVKVIEWSKVTIMFFFLSAFEVGYEEVRT